MKKKLFPLIKRVAVLTIFTATAALSAPYSAIVIDANTGEVLHEENADTRLHPAGLTKLMTLYTVFDALETGMVSLDDRVEVSLKAQVEPRAKLGLEQGQLIKLGYLIRATAVSGANDASTALAEGMDGTEVSFAKRMNGYSQELGLNRTRWKNAHGLTSKGHLSTARDIATLFRALRQDFPDYFTLFSRIRADAGLREVVSSSRRMLTNIRGIEGAKFGYTRAAGFNGAAYVKRGDEEVIAVIFGARSTATLGKRMQEILDDSFWELK